MLDSNNIQIAQPDRVVLITLPSWPEYSQEMVVCLSNNGTLAHEYSELVESDIGTQAHVDHIKRVAQFKKATGVSDVEHHSLEWADMKYMGSGISKEGITPILMLCAFIQKQSQTEE